MVGIKQYKALYLTIAVLAVGLLAVATGGGLWATETYWMADWQHRAFRLLCHQDPARSFSFEGTPMAVCSRCYGIYAGFTLLWVLMPLLGFAIREVGHTKKILLAAVILNMVDVIGNVLGIWQNTLTSRFILGTFIGVSVVLLLAGDFLFNKSQLKRDVYGFDGTTKLGA